MSLINDLRRWLNGKDPPSTYEAPAINPRNNKIKKVKNQGSANVIGGRDSFAVSDSDFEELQKAYNTDSYIRQAIDKYIELMFKSGWSINGSNQATVDYIRLRFQYMALLTGQPTEELFVGMGEDLVKYSNAFIIKSRQETPGIKAQSISGGRPVAGYFLASPLTMQIARDFDGSIYKYKQLTAGQEPIEFKPDDVIHMYYKKERGNAFGVPFLSSVLDDVKILRHLEESTIKMVHKNIWPIYTYTVGLPQQGYESTPDEIDEVKEDLDGMTIDSSIVMPERHKLGVVGAEGNALNVNEYLKYFEERVFTGLGVSAAMMGRSETVNRGTAEVMSSEMHDRVKAYQKTLQMFINTFIITELLLEGGFDPITDEKNMVYFRFAEIDLASKMALENHVVQKFITNTISHGEARAEMGLDPATDISDYFITKFGQVDQGAANTVSNKNQPANQNGKKAATKTK